VRCMLQRTRLWSTFPGDALDELLHYESAALKLNGIAHRRYSSACWSSDVYGSLRAVLGVLHACILL